MIFLADCLILKQQLHFFAVPLHSNSMLNEINDKRLSYQLTF